MLIIVKEKCADRKDLIDSAEQVQAMVNEVLKKSASYLKTGQGADLLLTFFEETRTRAEMLLKEIQEASYKIDTPAGVHADDWAWIKSLQ